MPIDQYSDVSFKRLYGLIQEYPQVEPFIKSASLDWEENEKCASSAFAWPERRMFRIDSPEQAALSRLYMVKQARVPKEVVAACDKALTLYGVDLPLTEKVAAAEDNLEEYLLPEVKRFRVVDNESVKLAAEAISRQRSKMSTTTHAQACIRLVKIATEKKQILPDSIYKAAGVTACSASTMRDWLEARAAAVPAGAIKTAYLKLAEHARAQEELIYDRNELVKTADVISQLDAAAGLEKCYGKTLPDPMATVFNTDKIAEGVLELAGRQVPVSRLLAVPGEAYADVFGQDLADEFVEPSGDIDEEQLRVILPTVPLDLQQALVSQLGL